MAAANADAALAAVAPSLPNHELTVVLKRLGTTRAEYAIKAGERRAKKSNVRQPSEFLPAFALPDACSVLCQHDIIKFSFSWEATCPIVPFTVECNGATETVNFAVVEPSSKRLLSKPAFAMAATMAELTVCRCWRSGL